MLLACVQSPMLRAEEAAEESATPVPAAAAAEVPTTQAVPQLPQSHEYQRVIRAYLGTLTEKDFEHGITEKLTVPPVNPDLEHQYRDYIYSMLQSPHVGGKRGIPAVNAPSHNFLLSTIEGKKAIIAPPVWSEALASFVEWDSPGNPYRNHRALRMRTFVACAVRLVMIDDYLDKNTGTGSARSDWNAYHLTAAAFSYAAFKNEIPAEVRKAYETGLLRLGRKLIAMGPKGESCDFEMGVPVALWHAAQATGDAAFAKEAEAYARRICTDPRFFHPAGYWVERGGFDIGFGGMANFWTIWLALASDWPFARETVEKAYQFKALMALPEPDGKFAGPSAFNTRLGTPATEDQWDWDGAREHAAAMVTDEAAFMVKWPAPEALADGVKNRTSIFNEHLYGALKNPPYKYPDGKRYQENQPKSGRYLRNDELRGSTWIWRIFPNGFNYPVETNVGYEFYRKDAYAHRMELQKSNPRMLQSPYLRGEEFVKNLGDAFVVARRKNFAAIIHMGPVGESIAGDGYAQYNGPLGFGGGQLSAFWTPGAGSAILGRRSGIAIQGENTKNFDVIADWRNWPLHAVTGVNAEGKLFTSARIVKPAVTHAVNTDRSEVKVEGTLPATFPGQEGALIGTMKYSRVFRLDDSGVSVETLFSGDGRETIAELYETIPVFHRDTKLQPQAALAQIEFQSSDGKWTAASNVWSEQVKAVKITRFAGAVVVAFDKPRRVKLSPADWKDTFLTRATSRSVLIDLLENSDKPLALKDAKKVSYRISPVKK